MSVRNRNSRTCFLRLMMLPLIAAGWRMSLLTSCVMKFGFAPRGLSFFFFCSRILQTFSRANNERVKNALSPGSRWWRYSEVKEMKWRLCEASVFTSSWWWVCCVMKPWRTESYSCWWQRVRRVDLPKGSRRVRSMWPNGALRYCHFCHFYCKVDFWLLMLRDES